MHNYRTPWDERHKQGRFIIGVLEVSEMRRTLREPVAKRFNLKIQIDNLLFHALLFYFCTHFLNEKLREV